MRLNNLYNSENVVSKTFLSILLFKKEIKIILEFKATLRNHPATLKEQERKSLSSAQRILSTNEVHSYDTLSHHKLKNNNFEQTTENIQK